MSLAVAQELYLAGGDADSERSRLFGFGVELGDLAGIEPAALVGAIERLGVAKGNGDTVTATLQAPDEWVEAYGAPLPDGYVELDIGADGRPEAYRLRMVAGDTSVEVEARFQDWGEPLDIEVPDLDDSNVTPWAQEVAVRAADVAVFTPRIPEDWTMTVSAQSAAEHFGDTIETCDMVTIDYRASQATGADHVTFRETPFECAMRSHAAPFTVNGPAGWPSRTSQAGALQLKLDGTVVEVDTSLTGTERDDILFSLSASGADILVAAAESRADSASGPVSAGQLSSNLHASALRLTDHDM